MGKPKTLQGLKNSVFGGGVYNRDGVVSVGARVGKVGSNIGGAIGMDKGKPFGSINVKGKVIKSFGPQDKDDMPKKVRRKK